MMHTRVVLHSCAMAAHEERSVDVASPLRVVIPDMPASPYDAGVSSRYAFMMASNEEGA